MESKRESRRERAKRIYFVSSFSSYIDGIYSSITTITRKIIASRDQTFTSGGTAAAC